MDKRTSEVVKAFIKAVYPFALALVDYLVQ